MLKAAGASVTGPEHLRRGTPNQDALALKGWRGGWIATVADGLGSKPASHLGARLAAQAGQRSVRRLSDTQPLAQLDPRAVATDLYRRWLAAVPLATKSDAACTFLMAACDGSGRARIWQFGDGLAACRSQGIFKVLTPARNGFGNETKALGTHRAWSDWHAAEVALERPGDAILLMTDGISDDLKPEALEAFANTLVQQLVAKSRRAGRAWLARELTCWATQHHTDDKTLAVIFRQ